MNQINIPTDIPEEHYKKILAIPVITEMELHFNELNQRASDLLTLIPSIITKPEYNVETMADLIGLYQTLSTKPCHCRSRVAFMEE